MPADRRHVLFVCVENSCRSQMAEAFARAIGEGRVEAHSAGSRPSGRVHPTAIRLMSERGIDLGQHRSKGVESLPAPITWDRVVTMGCGDACPNVAARGRADWRIADPSRMNDDAFREVRDRIEREVRALLAEIDR